MRTAWIDLLIFVLFLNVFFFHAFGTVALWLLLLALWILLIRVFETESPQQKKVKWVGSGVIALSLLTYVSVNSPEKLSLLVFTSLLTMFVCVYVWMKQGEVGGILELVLSGLQVMRAYLRSVLQVLRAMVVGNMRHILALDQVKKQSSPWTRSLMVGGLVGLPLVAWLVLTLAKADPVFATFVKEMLSENFLKELPWRLFFSLLALLALIPLLLMRLNEYVSPLGWLTRARWGREMAVVSGMVVLVMGIFLIVQWPYVFANVAKETELIKYGVATYSEYVTKGFWDLLKVAGMVFGVAWVGLLLHKNQKGAEKQVLLWTQGVLGLEFAIFIVSIFRRVWLYQSYHGLSLARLYGLALLIVLVGMVTTMALRYIYANVRFVKVEMAWLLFIVFGAVWINMESLVLQNPPTVNGRVDYVYLSRLSSDGKEGWVQAYQWAETALQMYENKAGTISRDERRDIYYAGLITRQLAINYHELIMRYGSEDELKAYFEGVVEVTQEAVLISPIDGSDAVTLQALKQRATDLEKEDWLDKVDITPIYPQHGVYRYDYATNRNMPYFSILNNEEAERLTGLNKLLTWDPNRGKAYQWIKNTISYENLLEMQVQDLSLQQRIALQGENERDFDVDISLDSPFLR